MLALLFLCSISGPAAWAHAGHGDGTFAPIFNELIRENFFVKPAGLAGPANAFAKTPDGQPYALDSKYWDAVRRQAANFDVPIDEPPPPEFAPPWSKRNRGDDLPIQPWTQYFDGVAKTLFKNVRRLGIDIGAAGLDGFHRFGISAAALILTAEGAHHLIELTVPGGQALLPFSVPLCHLVQVGCLYVAARTQEYAFVLTKPFPGIKSIKQRYAALALSKDLRKARRRALRDVRDKDGVPITFTHEGRELTDGADVLKTSCFRSALAQADPDGVCDVDHAAGLRYRPKASEPASERPSPDVPVAVGKFKLGGARGAFGATPKSRFTARAIEDRPDRHPLDFEIGSTTVARAWGTEDFVEFMHLQLDLAKLAAGDLRDNQTRAFFGLRRQVSAMRKALDFYAFTLRLRAVLRTERTFVDKLIDARFESSLKYFLIGFDQRLQAILTKANVPTDRYAPFRRAPEAALQLVKDWVRPVVGLACGEDLAPTANR